jgi:glycine/D-amino acid oxidase-like deaminating enzyme
MEYKIDRRWSGIMGFGDMKTPIVQKYNDHIYIAARMSGMGIAIGSMIGEEVADLIVKNE